MYVQRDCQREIPSDMRASFHGKQRENLSQLREPPCTLSANHCSLLGRSAPSVVCAVCTDCHMTSMSSTPMSAALFPLLSHSLSPGGVAFCAVTLRSQSAGNEMCVNRMHSTNKEIICYAMEKTPTLTPNKCLWPVVTKR